MEIIDIVNVKLIEIRDFYENFKLFNILIMEKIFSKDIKVGELYWYGDAFNFLVLISRGGEFIQCSKYISVDKKDYCKYGGGCTQKEYGIPTEREKMWFLECEKHEKYFPVEEFVTPEYQIY